MTTFCPLCFIKASLEHLSSCPKALADAWYCWCHERVLKAVAYSLSHQHQQTLSCSEEGNSHHHTWRETGPQATTVLLHTTPVWQLHVDLGKQRRFPRHIATTPLQPSMLITSEASKHLILTCSALKKNRLRNPAR